MMIFDSTTIFFYGNFGQIGGQWLLSMCLGLLSFLGVCKDLYTNQCARGKTCLHENFFEWFAFVQQTMLCKVEN